ncbi:MAG: redoxin domain-containing protein [Acidobacteria bacterium]|nr:redoxin domain-containing protein [Acidobacteriota bacterium]
MPGLAAAAVVALFAAGDWTLMAPSGATVGFDELRGGVTVVAFTSTRCPVSGMYQQRLNDLYREFSSKGVAFVVVNANSNEPPAEIQKYSKQASLPYPVYKDFHNRLADAYEIESTPEVVVLDRAGEVRYRGAIDDSSNPARVKVHALRDAVTSLLAGKTPQIARLKAFGCVLKREKKTT